MAPRKGKSTNNPCCKKPNWPEIRPKSNLIVTQLKDNSNHLFTVHDFLDSTESRAFIKVAESLGFVHQGSLGPARGEAFRDNDRISVNDPMLAENIWRSGLENLFADIKVDRHVAVGLNPNIRFYRYSVGQRFGPHIDESIDVGAGQETGYTVLVYLNGCVKSKTEKVGGSDHNSVNSLVGGETVFYDNRKRIFAEVVPVEGMALCHLHGEKCMLH